MIGVELKDVTELFIPMSIMHNHWVAVLIDVENQIINYYDPFSGSNIRCIIRRNRSRMKPIL